MADKAKRRTRSVTGDQLYARVAQILEHARSQIARTVNTVMVQAYWLVGREIVEVEQAGAQRAGYGEEVIERLSVRPRKTLGKGFSAPNLRSMRQFFLAFPSGSALPEVRQALPGESDDAIWRALPGKSRPRQIRQALPSKSGPRPRRALPPARARARSAGGPPPASAPGRDEGDR